MSLARYIALVASLFAAACSSSRTAPDGSMDAATCISPEVAT
jgi:hypothetical protein